MKWPFFQINHGCQLLLCDLPLFSKSSVKKKIAASVWWEICCFQRMLTRSPHSHALFSPALLDHVGTWRASERHASHSLCPSSILAPLRIETIMRSSLVSWCRHMFVELAKGWKEGRKERDMGKGRERRGAKLKLRDEISSRVRS